jgi:hypothetical protein
VRNRSEGEVSADRKREAALMRDIQAAIGSMKGVICHRNNVGTAVFNGARVEYGVGGKGAPDLVCEVRVDYIGGYHWTMLWMEVKTAEGVIEPHQTRWHLAARKQGRDCCVVRSVADALRAIDQVKSSDMTMYDRSNDQARCEGE